MNFDLKMKELSKWYELSDEDGEEFLNNFNEWLLENKSSFLSWMTKNKPLDSTTLCPLYFALSKNYSEWGDLIVLELRRLLETASKSDEKQIKSAIFDSLECFIMNDKEDNPVFAKIRQIIVEYLSNTKDLSIKRFLTYYVGNFIGESDTFEIQLLEQLTQNSDWQTRVLAYYTLNEIRQKPLKKGIPFLDRIRLILQDPFKY